LKNSFFVKFVYHHEVGDEAVDLAALDIKQTGYEGPTLEG